MNDFMESMKSDAFNLPEDDLEEGVHPSAYIHPDAELGTDVTVGPFSFIGKNVRLGDECILKNHVNLTGRTTIGKGNLFYPYASIGTLPQDLSYDGDQGTLEIGDHNVFRESVTVNTGTEKDLGKTTIGSENLFMAYSHVAHDCIIDDRIVMANGVQLGGHVTIHSGVVFGGLAAVHHFVTIGRHAFVGGLSRLMKDLPPFMMAAGDPANVHSLNSEGLRRNGFSQETINELKSAHKKIFRENGPRIEKLDQLRNEDGNPSEVNELLSFIENMRESPQGRAREVERDF